MTALRTDIERTGFELNEAEVSLARLDADRERLAAERNQADEKLREISKRARAVLESRIAELRSAEADLARERTEQERLLAALVEKEKRAERERKNAEKSEQRKIEAERAVVKAEADRDTTVEAAANVRAATALDAEKAAEDAAEHDRASAKKSKSEPVNGKTESVNGKTEPANGKTEPANGKIEPVTDKVESATEPTPVNGRSFDFSALGDYTDETVQAQIDAHHADGLPHDPGAPNGKRPQPVAEHAVEDDGPVDALTHYKRSLAASEARHGQAGEDIDEELIPGFRSFIGNIFTRPKSTRPDAPEEEREEPPEGASIADRIARDFGLLGGDPPKG